jgi:hypothetical protein
MCSPAQEELAVSVRVAPPLTRPSGKTSAIESSITSSTLLTRLPKEIENLVVRGALFLLIFESSVKWGFV